MPAFRTTPHRATGSLPAGILAAALLAAACAPAPPEGPSLAPDDRAAYRGFLVPAPLLPLQAVGSVLFNYRGERESGNLTIEGRVGPVFRLLLSTRIIGSSALEIRFDPARLLVLDFVDESFYLGDNTAENRRKLFSIDISPEEFLILLTARVTEKAFAAAGGHTAGEGEIVLRRDGAEYRFLLDDEGLPREWSKAVGGRTVFRVEYRDYLIVEEPGAAPLRFPRKIRVYAGEPEPRLVIGIGEFLPWRMGRAPIDFHVDPEDGLRFLPLPENGVPPDPPAEG